MGDHYVPQYLLQGFSQADRLWAHDRQLKRSFLTQPKAIAHETNMYPPALEAFLANKIEGPANEAIDKVRDLQPLDAKDRTALAHYIVALWKRVPDGRERAAKRLPAVAIEIEDGVLAGIDELVAADPSLSALAQTRREEVSAIIRRYIDEPPVEFWHQSLKTPATPKMADALLSMNWRFLRAPRGSFLSCDNPVFFFGSEGIGQPTSELTLAFSSSVALWANRRPAPIARYWQAAPRAVAELNRRAAANATRFLFSERDEPWMMRLHLKAHWSLNRLA